jgi:hypothetical protein
MTCKVHHRVLPYRRDVLHLTGLISKRLDLSGSLMPTVRLSQMANLTGLFGQPCRREDIRSEFREPFQVSRFTIQGLQFNYFVRGNFISISYLHKIHSHR